MKKFIKYILLIIAFSLIYIVLREKIDLYIFLAGCVIAFIAIILADTFLLDEKYINIYKLKIFRFIFYIVFLIYKIFSSGVRAVILTITGKARHEFITFRSELNDDFRLNLLANSITLTPGTVTVNRDGGSILIIKLCKLDKDISTKDIKKFEDKLLKM